MIGDLEEKCLDFSTSKKATERKHDGINFRETVGFQKGKPERKSKLIFDNGIGRTQEERNLIDARQLANRLGMSVWTIRKWKSRQEIPYLVIGKKSVRYDYDAVVNHLQKRR